MCDGLRSAAVSWGAAGTGGSRPGVARPTPPGISFGLCWPRASHRGSNLPVSLRIRGAGLRGVLDPPGRAGVRLHHALDQHRRGGVLRGAGPGEPRLRTAQRARRPSDALVRRGRAGDRGARRVVPVVVPGSRTVSTAAPTARSARARPGCSWPGPLLVSVVLLPPAFLMGATLPLVCARFAVGPPHRRLGRRVLRAQHARRGAGLRREPDWS